LSSVSEGNEYWATVQSKSRDPELPEEDRKYFAELPKYQEGWIMELLRVCSVTNIKQADA
jgi:hypothetical protein